MPLPRSVFAALFALLLLSAGLAPPVAAQEPARTVRDSVTLPADGALSVDNHEGSITVTTWDRSVVRYEAQIMPTDEDPDAKKVSIKAESTGNQLRLATVHEDGDDESVVFGFTEDGFQWGGVDIPAVHYTITLPRTAALTLDDHESTVNVTGHAGRLRIDSHDGPITVEDQQGPLTVDTHDSPVTIVDQTGDVRLDTHDGDVEARGVTGRLALDTHDGDLTVSGLSGGLRFESHDGSASVSISALSAAVLTDTHDGDVTLTLPADAGFFLATDLSDDSDVLSDFDLQSIRQGDPDDDVNYRGDVNGGGPEIRIESNDGDVTLRSGPAAQ
jgi:hypothetical protein